MKILDKMQRRVAIWILGAFKTSPSEGIEAIARIIPIRFHLQKITKRLQMRPFKLPSNHILRNLMDDSPPFVHFPKSSFYWFFNQMPGICNQRPSH